jgi:hypothetical protein
MPEGLYAAFYGPVVIDSLCHYVNPIKSCDVLEDKNLVQLTSGGKYAVHVPLNHNGGGNPGTPFISSGFNPGVKICNPGNENPQLGKFSSKSLNFCQ